MDKYSGNAEKKKIKQQTIIKRWKPQIKQNNTKTMDTFSENAERKKTNKTEQTTKTTDK